MSWMTRVACGLAWLVAVTPSVEAASPGGAKRMEPSPAAAQAMAIIDRVLDGEAAAEMAAALLPPHSPVREAVATRKLDAAREMLAFRPLDEAPIPEGFPAFTPVGLIEVKRYPAYRKATGSGFWPLFRHIQTQGIPMTAPVEMNKAPGVGGRGEMAFLYQNTKVGETGTIDGIEVGDTKPALYASLGMRGYRDKQSTEEARKRLLAWAVESPEYDAVNETAGGASFRLLGYNSPGVRGDDRYWEAQVRVVRTGAKEQPTN